MGAIWLLDLADWLRDGGVTVREYPDWKTRARSSGGFDQVWGIVAHHTASNNTWQNDTAYEWQNAATKPIGNCHLDRTGVWTVGAAGATNTNGRGLADWHTSHGVIPIEPTTMGNRMAFAIEAGNNGIGETWPRAQMDSYLRGMNILCERLNLDPSRDVNTHRGWAGTRKSDPFGPAEGYPTLGSQSWLVPELRKLVAAATPPDPLPGDDDMTDEQMEELAQRTADKVYARMFNTRHGMIDFATLQNYSYSRLGQILDNTSPDDAA